MKIVDCRFRPNTKDTIDGLVNSCIFREGLIANGIDIEELKTKAQEIEDIVADLRRLNVDKAVIVGRDAETTYGFKPNNDSVTEYLAAAPDLFIGLAGLDPHKGMESVYTLEKLVKEQGFGGAAIDPIYAQIAADDARFYPIYAKCCELDVPIVITTGPARFTPKSVTEHAAPQCIDHIARDFPELKIIVSHGAYPFVTEMIGTAFRHKNVYIEFSEYELFPGSEAFVQAANTILSDRILFASAHPFVFCEDAIKLYETLPFNDEVREKIMYKNALSIFA